MPITNGKYVAPTWKNNGSPALSAANMQDISDALAFSGRIATGSYTGTGTSGSGNQNSLTLPFEPKILFISGSQFSLVLYSPSTTKQHLWSSYNSGNVASNFLLWYQLSGKTVSWYISGNAGDIASAALQLNESGLTYQYVAFG